VTTIIRPATFLLRTAILATIQPVTAQKKSTADRPIEALVRAIESDNIATVDIFRIPNDVLFRVNVSPARLESWWAYKLTIRSLGLHAEDLTIVLRAAAIQPSTTKLESLDLRWGIVFYSKVPQGKRIASLYFDKTGREGAANDASASFGPEFLPGLKNALHPSLE
jgi:hypothetical protein